VTFISFNFYIFLTVLVVLYYLIPLAGRWIVLLGGSLYFYWHVSQSSLLSFCMLIGLAFICWICSQFMKQNNKYKKFLLIISVCITACPLLVIKEAPFINSTIIHKSLPEWWIVPVGIAFFSLQLIAYAVDVYKGKVNAAPNFFKFLLFVSFFPQIIQGPIPRYGQLSEQLTAANKFDEKSFVKSFMLIIWGFFLKLCIADKAGIIVNLVFDNYPTYCGMYVLIAGILYSFQLYADFLACTTLAQGIAGLFGINVINNFARPYFSDSIKDFWRRWHISLSSWLRDYIYIPLGGNKKGKVRKYVNLIITFIISGIWHGAGYKFVFWGLMHGSYQVVGELMTPVKVFLNRELKLENHPYFKKTCNTVTTFILVMFAWIIFRAERLKTGLSMIKSIFTVHNPWILTNNSLFNLGLSWKEFMVLILCLCVLLFVSILQERGIQIREKILQGNLVTRWGIYIGAIVFIMVFGTYGYGFDAQAFIYGGF